MPGSALLSAYQPHPLPRPAFGRVRGCGVEGHTRVAAGGGQVAGNVGESGGTALHIMPFSVNLRGDGNGTLTAACYARAMLRKYNNIFRSRWKAVSWALGVMLTAYCTVPSADETEAAKKAEVAHGGHGQNHKNPWARDDPAAN